MSSIMAISRHRMGTDGPGITTLVAFHGCPLHCHYCINSQCHNPYSTVQADYDATELLDILSIDEPYFLMTGGGIAFGGGEPLLQADFIHEVCGKMDPRWKRTMETSLYADWQSIDLLKHDINLWYVDVKEIDPFVYQKYTGAPNDIVLSNLKKLVKKVGVEKVRVRYPLIPGYNCESDRNFGILFLWDEIHPDLCIEEFQYIRTQ